MISSYEWMRKNCFETEINDIEGRIKKNINIDDDYTNIRKNVLQYMKRELNYINEMINYYESK
jgi:hypothetical protein|tara:strand:+ start:784 stop:972 length:189 start_codon:yes stop_codon:yes gene_type:complete